MGHVWSGTASEKTPAYQGITLLQDHIVHLHNGALLDLTVNGAVSVDLNGKIEISLFSRKADTRFEQK
jgi:microsomal triglyceride transfer protein large subunit